MSAAKPDALASYVAAERAVFTLLLQRGIEHACPLREAIVDHVALAMRKHGIPEGTRMAEGIAHEQARWRANKVEAESDAYRAAGGSRGLVSGKEVA